VYGLNRLRGQFFDKKIRKVVIVAPILPIAQDSGERIVEIIFQAF